MWGEVTVDRIVYDPPVKSDERASGVINTLHQLPLNETYNQDKDNNVPKTTTTTWDCTV